jgi:hypothetical protein
MRGSVTRRRDGAGLSVSKLASIFLAVLAGLIVNVGYGGYRPDIYVEYDPAFCDSCQLMEKVWKTWLMALL